MKVRLLLFLFIACVVSTAYAGPFEDVPAGHWAYNSMAQLAENGLVSGFDVSDTLTRYDMAILVGKAMEHGEQADVETQKQLEDLAAEFSQELEGFGVKFSESPSKPDHIKGLLDRFTLTGDFYLRYYGDRDSVDGSNSRGNYGRIRVRLNLEAKVSDNLSAYVRFTSRNLFSGSSSRDAWQTDTDTSYQQLDQYGVKYTIGKYSIQAGRQDAFLGQGMIISTGSDAQWPNQFDGIVARADFDIAKSSFMIGKTTKSNPLGFYGDNRAGWLGFDVKSMAFKGFSLGVAAAHHSFDKNQYNPLDLQRSWNNWAVNLTYTAIPRLTLNAEYTISSNDDDNRGYFISGTYALTKRDSVTITYVDTERQAVDPYNSVYGSLIPLNWGAGINVNAAGDTPLSRNFEAWQIYCLHTINAHNSVDLYLIDAKAPGYSGHDLEGFVSWNVYF